ncbi:MAG: diaminopimelate epimerase [Synergistaceae bacterium]|nr:diaminopimelate epimerase [Synergistaceae bacterium]
MKFTKMHGCGNDYIYVDCINSEIPDNPEKLAIKISDRHFGVGSDGLILILPGENADAFMQLYNADGSKGTMCGNGIRCTAKFIYDHGIIPSDRTKTKIETPAGIKEISLDIENHKVISATVDMGIAELTSELPEKITVHNKNLKFIGAYTGTDHAVYFVDDNPEIENILSWTDSEFAVEGKYFETHSRFVNRVNSEFIEVISRDEIKMRVFERGSGETLACGTGATASVFAGVISGKLNRGKNVLVHLRGGDLKIKVEADNRCFMTGPAVEVFEGRFPI